MATRKASSGRGWRSAALTALALAAVACSHHHNNSASVTTTTNNTTTTSNLADSFGAGFGADFGAGANTQPASVSASDVNPVSNTTQPTSLSNIGG